MGGKGVWSSRVDPGSGGYGGEPAWCPLGCQKSHGAVRPKSLLWPILVATTESSQKAICCDAKEESWHLENTLCFVTGSHSGMDTGR